MVLTFVVVGAFALQSRLVLNIKFILFIFISTKFYICMLLFFAYSCQRLLSIYGNYNNMPSK